MPSVLALISDMFRDPKQLGAAMGIWGSPSWLASSAGPVVEGTLLGSFWWARSF
jgi:DHA2 family multidrug resistance protein-like MFS transporter